MIVDAHEDIAWNMLTFGRDYLRGNQFIREQERATAIPAHNGTALLGRDAWLDGEVAIIFSTLFTSPARKSLGAWDNQVYSNQQEAYTLASREMDVYRELAEQHPFQVIETQADLKRCLDTWEPQHPIDDRKIGLVVLMEGADPVLEPQQVAQWHERGVRIIGPAWESTRYAGGTHEPGPLTDDGIRLLAEMQSLGMILDLSHLSEEAYYQALDRFEGVLIVSHANPRRFLPTSRGLSDEMIRLLVERRGVVGVVLYNLFLKPSWKSGDPKEAVSLRDVADVIDHICQLTGTTEHVGLGSDFDGGFGLEHAPAEIDTIADLNRLRGLLAERGYTADDIDRILSGNWLRILRAGLPA